MQLDYQTEVKVLRELFRYAAQSKVDKRITTIIKQRRFGIKARHYFEAWMIKYHKRRIDRVRTEKIKAEKESRLSFFGLQRWLERHRFLRFAELKLRDRTLHKVKDQHFSLWLFKYRGILQLRKQYEDLVTKVGQYKCRVALAAWGKYHEGRRTKKQLVKLGRFKLLQTVMTRTFQGLRYYAHYSKQKRLQPLLRKQKIMRRCLFLLNHRALQLQRTRLFLARKRRLILSVMFGLIKDLYLAHSQRREKFREWKLKRIQHYQTRVLEALRVVVKNGSKLILQKHERIRLAYTFK